ncbi:MAG: CBS domain-containing protein [Tenacibaculum sp.]
MNIQDFILNQIKELSPEHTIACAQEICKNLTISHIPIVKNKKLLGCLPESDIQTIGNKDGFLKDYNYLFNYFYTNERATLLDLISLFADNDCNLIPVLDKELNYLGYFELGDILNVFANSPFLHSNSETIIVEKPQTAYSMSQISQIVESNKGKLLGMYIACSNEEKVQICLKVSTDSLNRIIQTFRRYDYVVLSQHEDDFYLKELKNQDRYLRKYLSM